MRYGSVEIRTSGARARYAAWVAYAACAWAFVFAALSFYWAAGGTAGAETIGEAVTKPVLARDPGWIALLWATGALKALGGLLALSLVQPWGRVIPRWMRLAAAWGAGTLIFLYGGAGMVQFALMAAGALSIPASVGATAVRWHLLLWEPWWMLGGLLFMAAAWLAGRRGA
jgi:uncharacterized protein DUF3995